MGASHTGVATEGTEGDLQYTIRPGVGEIDFSHPRPPEQLVDRLAGKVGAELALFSSRAREGLLAATVSIGLEAMPELMERTSGGDLISHCYSELTITFLGLPAFMWASDEES